MSQEIAHPASTRYVIAHDGGSTVHLVEVTPAHVCTTGQPTLDDYDSEAGQAGRLLEMDLPQERMDALIEVYQPWEKDEPVEEDDVRRYRGTLYRCVQAHDTQEDWTPDATPALWTPVVPAGVIPEWVQPTGAQDAYNIGDQVTHEGQVWESQIDANTTEPGTLVFDYWIAV